ncbi:MAG: ANTAR domain-containing response regulator [Burkholderiales bacterium]
MTQSILLLNRDVSHGSLLRTILVSLGYVICDELQDAKSLDSDIARVAPDVLVVCTDSLKQSVLDALRRVAESCPLPVVVFANDGNREAIRKAVAAGAAAYVVQGWTAERLTSIIDAACARFEAFQSVRDELAATQHKLSERKLIEKAKGIVMKQRGLAEDEAYSALRKMAMNQNLALAEVARRVIAVSQLLA